MAWKFEFDVEISEDLDEEWDTEPEERYDPDPDGIIREYWQDRI